MAENGEPTSVLWFSRHEMTEDQQDALGPNVQIDQIDRSINSAYELQGEIGSHDVIAIVAPINLQQQFLNIAGDDKPVIMAANERVLVPDENGGESKVEFHFTKWEQLDEINVDKHDYEPADKQDGESTSVLWFSRHEMTDEQKAALGDNVQVDQVDKTISSAYELKDEIDSHDVIAVVAPINLQAQFISIAGEDKPVISAVSDRILVPDPDGGESKVEFQFNKWEQLDKIEVVKHDYEPQDKVDRDEDEHELTAADDAEDDAAVEEENPDIDANGEVLEGNAVDADGGNDMEGPASDDIQDANDSLDTDTDDDPKDVDAPTDDDALNDADAEDSDDLNDDVNDIDDDFNDVEDNTDDIDDDFNDLDDTANDTDDAPDDLNDDANDMEDVPNDNDNDSFDDENNSNDVDADFNDVDDDSNSDNMENDEDYWDSGDSVD